MVKACVGVLLAGGLARRMGGGDKPLRTIAGATLLDRAITALRPQCDGLILNVNGDPFRFENFGLPLVQDDPQEFYGPLAGVLAGLDWIAAHRPDIDFAVSAPTDTPFLPGDLVARLAEARAREGADIACASSGGVAHPVVALWPISIRQDLRRALVEEDLRKIDRFTARYRLAVVDWASAPIDPFFNANEPGDLAAAETIAAARSRDPA